MVKLFRNPRRQASDRSRSRKLNPDQIVNRVGLNDLAPDLKTFLTVAGYLQLSFFELLSGAVLAAPSIEAKLRAAQIAQSLLSRHLAIVARLKSEGFDPAEQMEPISLQIDDFRARLTGTDWYESMLGYFVASGILDEALISISLGYSSELPKAMAELLDDEQVHSIVVESLQEAIESNPRLASRLALFGRSLVGDVFLVTRSALRLPAESESDEERLEPAFTELIANHTRRMDELGLTA
ncbi:MAG: hypothetical protein IT191_01930 [Microbacteriaceae bacterium]|nr:hypothetical protein [Cryobacterium sp.]MBX3104164.1 hypothetical protein [Cryobacterium sp.]MCC6375759.1 hypothetical protein [Microbacteriaceae bacterium]